MSIITQKDLPVNDILRKENIQILDERTNNNTIKDVIQVLILNLMPLKEETELQLLRKLSCAKQDLKVTFCHVVSYVGKSTDPEHVKKYYSTFEDIKNKKFDGLIITGAPVEQMRFEDVAYWDELIKIIDWSKKNVRSTLYICWGAQAGLYHNYGIEKILMNNKIFGVFEHDIINKNSKIMTGFENKFKAPHSRHTTISKEEIEKILELRIVSESKEAGVFIVENEEKKEIYVTGHLEYSIDTLEKEYERDLNKGLKIDIPKNYYKNDDIKNETIFSWKENGDKLYSNWVNYYLK